MRSTKRHFRRHYLEMVAAMFAGMAVLGALTYGAQLITGLELPTAAHPELASLKMAFDMSVGMVVWMRHRGHRWPATLEMTGAMFAPALTLMPLLWLGVIGADTMQLAEHVLMLPVMWLVMLRRRSEYDGPVEHAPRTRGALQGAGS